MSVADTNSLLHVVADYAQSEGDFEIVVGAGFEVEGTFNKVGTGVFKVRDGSTFSVGDLTAGSVEAGEVWVAGGSQVTMRDLTANTRVEVKDAGTLLHIVEDFLQTDGDFFVWGGSAFDADGTFTKIGNGGFEVAQGSTFIVGDLTAGSVEAGDFRVREGSQVAIRDLTVNTRLEVRNAGTSLHVMEDFEQTDGDFFVLYTSAFDVDGSFSKIGSGNFEVAQGSTLNVGDLTTGSVEAGDFRVREGSQVTIHDLMAGSYVLVTNTDSLLNVVGEFTLADSTVVLGGDSFVILGSGNNVGTPGVIEVRADGTLSGTGIVSADVFNAGLVSPGTSPGELLINGNYEHTAGGTLEFGIGVDGSGLLGVSGSMTIGEGTALVVTLDPGIIPTVGQQYVIVTGDSGVYGTFSEELLQIVAGESVLTWAIHYNPTDITLEVVDVGAPGDLNCDDLVDETDIAPFVLALTDPGGYVAAFPSCNIMRADMNRDGASDGLDIQQFVEAVMEP